MKEAVGRKTKLRLIALSIDTEGSVSVNLFRKRNLEGEFKFLQMEPTISICTNNSKELLEYIAKICKELWPETNFYLEKKAIRLYGNIQGLKVLKEVLPFLIVKEEKARKLIAFCECRRGKHGPIKYSQEEIELALSIRSRPLKPWARDFLLKRGYKI